MRLFIYTGPVIGLALTWRGMPPLRSRWGLGFIVAPDGQVVAGLNWWDNPQGCPERTSL